MQQVKMISEFPTRHLPYSPWTGQSAVTGAALRVPMLTRAAPRLNHTTTPALCSPFLGHGGGLRVKSNLEMHYNTRKPNWLLKSCLGPGAIAKPSNHAASHAPHKYSFPQLLTPRLRLRACRRRQGKRPQEAARRYLKASRDHSPTLPKRMCTPFHGRGGSGAAGPGEYLFPY